MPSENEAVNIRSSFEARNFWVNNIQNPNISITDSLRITFSKSKNKVFSEKEIGSFNLPFQRQHNPKEINFNISNKENQNKKKINTPQNGHYPSPIRIRNSRSIEREVFQRELEIDELCFQDHIRKINQMSQRHKEVLTINKALAGHQQRFYIL